MASTKLPSLLILLALSMLYSHAYSARSHVTTPPSQPVGYKQSSHPVPHSHVPTPPSQPVPRPPAAPQDQYQYHPTPFKLSANQQPPKSVHDDGSHVPSPGKPHYDNEPGAQPDPHRPVPPPPHKSRNAGNTYVNGHHPRVVFPNPSAPTIPPTAPTPYKLSETAPTGHLNPHDPPSPIHQ